MVLGTRPASNFLEFNYLPWSITRMRAANLTFKFNLKLFQALIGKCSFFSFALASRFHGDWKFGGLVAGSFGMNRGFTQ